MIQKMKNIGFITILFAISSTASASFLKHAPMPHGDRKESAEIHEAKSKIAQRTKMVQGIEEVLQSIELAKKLPAVSNVQLSQTINTRLNCAGVLLDLLEPYRNMAKDIQDLEALLQETKSQLQKKTHYTLGTTQKLFDETERMAFAYLAKFQRTLDKAQQELEKLTHNAAVNAQPARRAIPQPSVRPAPAASAQPAAFSVHTVPMKNKQIKAPLAPQRPQTEPLAAQPLAASSSFSGSNTAPVVPAIKWKIPSTVAALTDRNKNQVAIDSDSKSNAEAKLSNAHNLHGSGAATRAAIHPDAQRHLATSNPADTLRMLAAQRLANANSQKRAASEQRAMNLTKATPAPAAASRDPKIETRKCGSCAMNLPHKDFLMLSCGHNATCQSCLNSHFNYGLSSKNSALVRCFDEKCKKELPLEDVAKFINDKVKVAQWKAHFFKECNICMDAVRTKNFLMLSCGHNATCTNCLNSMFEGALKEKSDKNLRCPDTKCKQELLPEDVAALTKDKSKRTLWDEILLEKCLAQMPNMKRCPTPNCTYAFAMPTDEEGLAIADAFTDCPQCKKNYCSRCLLPHSKVMSCKEAEENRGLGADKRKAEKETRELLEKTTKKCPQCQAAIEKNEGCNHMTCTKCRYEFNWCCLSRFDPSLYPAHQCPQQVNAGGAAAAAPNPMDPRRLRAGDVMEIARLDAAAILGNFIDAFNFMIAIRRAANHE